MKRQWNNDNLAFSKDGKLWRNEICTIRKSVRAVIGGLASWKAIDFECMPRWLRLTQHNNLTEAFGFVTSIGNEQYIFTYSHSLSCVTKPRALSQLAVLCFVVCFFDWNAPPSPEFLGKR